MQALIVPSRVMLRSEKTGAPSGDESRRYACLRVKMNQKLIL